MTRLDKSSKYLGIRKYLATNSTNVLIFGKGTISNIKIVCQRRVTNTCRKNQQNCQKKTKKQNQVFLKYATKLLQELRSQEVGRNLKLNSRN